MPGCRQGTILAPSPAGLPGPGSVACGHATFWLRVPTEVATRAPAVPTCGSGDEPSEASAARSQQRWRGRAVRFGTKLGRSVRAGGSNRVRNGTNGPGCRPGAGRVTSPHATVTAARRQRRWGHGPGAANAAPVTASAAPDAAITVPAARGEWRPTGPVPMAARAGGGRLPPSHTKA